MAGIPTYSNALAVSDTTTDGQTVTLACASNYTTEDKVECKCNAIIENPTFICSPNTAPTCKLGK